MKTVKMKVVIAILMSCILISPSIMKGQTLTTPHTEDFNGFPDGAFIDGTNGWTDDGGTSFNTCIYLTLNWSAHTKSIIIRNRNYGLQPAQNKWPVNLVSPEIVVSGTNPIASWAETSYGGFNTTGTKNSLRKLFVKKITDLNWSELVSYSCGSLPDQYPYPSSWFVRTVIIPSQYSGQTVQFRWECQSLNDEYVYWCLDNIYFGSDSPVIEIVGETEAQELDFHSLPYWESSDRILTVNNSGPGTLIVGAAYITTPTGSKFSVSSQSGSITYDPGQMKPRGFDIYVNFDPVIIGPYSSTLNIPYQINGINSTYTLTLKGTGIDCSDVMELVEPDPPANQVVDILGFQDQLYKYTATFPQDIVINSCFPSQGGHIPGTQGGADYAWDTWVRVYSSCPFTPADLLIDNDDMESDCPFNRSSSQVVLSLKPCQTIYIHWPLYYPDAPHAIDPFHFQMIVTPTGPVPPPLNLVLSGNTHVYSGYNNAYNTTELTATASGGTPPYTYLWLPTETGQTISVMPSTQTTYTVIVTDFNGCSVAGDITVNVEDVKAYDEDGNVIMAGGDPKIIICQTINNNPHEIVVNWTAVDNILAGGNAQLGECPDLGPIIREFLGADDLTFDVYPNPNNGTFNVQFNLNEKSAVTIELKSILGTTIYREVLPITEGVVSKEIDQSNLKQGLYFIQITNAYRSVSKTIVIN